MLRQMHDYGVRVKMITGDHATTAQAIAGQFGLNDGGRVLTGKELFNDHDVIYWITASAIAVQVLVIRGSF